VFVWEDAKNTDDADLRATTEDGQYDTSSWDSRWVQQHLAWCDPGKHCLGGECHRMDVCQTRVSPGTNKKE
jgi:hypothetical protein